MNSLFKNPNINFTGKSITTNIIPVTFVNSSEDFYDSFSSPLSNTLSSIYKNGFSKLDNLSVDFFNGIINPNLYTESYLTSLSILLLKLKTNNSIINNLLSFLQRIITVFKVAYDLSVENEYLKERLEECRQKASILDDYEKLKQYVSEFNKRLYPIEDQNVTMTENIKIKKEYLSYIKKYGFPQNGVFDFSKLQEFYI